LEAIGSPVLFPEPISPPYSSKSREIAGVPAKAS
jgi:hypothetical protein